MRVNGCRSKRKCETIWLCFLFYSMLINDLVSAALFYTTCFFKSIKRIHTNCPRTKRELQKGLFYAPYECKVQRLTCDYISKWKKKSRILYRAINTFLPVKRGDVPNGCFARDTVFHLVRIRTVVLLVLSLATQNCLFALNRHIRLMSFVLPGYSLCFVFLFLFFSTNYSVPKSSFFFILSSCSF